MVVEFEHEAVVQKSPEILNGSLRQLTETTVDKFLSRNGIDCPENAKTLLLIHTYFSYMRNPNQKTDDVFMDLATFTDVIEEEKALAKDVSIPSIGIEVEVPQDQFPITFRLQGPYTPINQYYDQIKRDFELFNMTIKEEEGGFGINTSRTEFEFPATNSADLQWLLYQEFVGMGFISENPLDRYIDSKGTEQALIANMHANFGIPINEFTIGFYPVLREASNASVDPETVKLVREYASAMMMLFACGYTDPERILGGYKEPWRFNTWAQGMTSIKEASTPSRNVRQIARLELRVLRVTDRESMRQLFRDAQKVAKPLCVVSEENVIFMRKFIEAVKTLVGGYDIEIDALDIEIDAHGMRRRNPFGPAILANILDIQRKISSLDTRSRPLFSQARALASKYALAA